MRQLPSLSPTRRFVFAIAGALLVPRAAMAQTTRRRRIAYLAFGSRATAKPYLGALQEGLRGLGYREDDIEIIIRYGDEQPERLPDLAAELVRLAPEVIVAGSAAVAKALKQATSTIPIVIGASQDPVGLGFVASLAHPGGNITCLSTLADEMVAKWIELLRSLTPAAERIAVLGNSVSSPSLRRPAQQAAQSLHLELLWLDVRVPGEIESAFTAVVQGRAEGLVVSGDAVFLHQIGRIVKFAANQKLPAIYQYRTFAAAGGLMSYGPDIIDLFRRAAVYVDKILKGAKPGDLPVEQPTKFELVLNLRAAKALDLAMPQSLIARADEVIE